MLQQGRECPGRGQHCLLANVASLSPGWHLQRAYHQNEEGGVCHPEKKKKLHQQREQPLTACCKLSLVIFLSSSQELAFLRGQSILILFLHLILSIFEASLNRNILLGRFIGEWRFTSLFYQRNGESSTQRKYTTSLMP